MSLTAGATLQNGKYSIQTALHQSETGVSYRATHVILNQPVVIQTLNPSLRQSPRFDWLRQQFLAIVRQGGTAAAIVRDCFEEDGMPYVVLEAIQPSIKPSDWMPFLNAVPSPIAPNGTATSAVTGAVTGAIAPPQALPQLPVLPAPVAIAPIAPRHSHSTSARKRWLPLALVLTACGAGLSGAAFGWRLRQAATASSAPALFSREQSFPEKTDWLGEDPYADDYSRPDDYSDSASPAIERRSITPRRRQIAPEPESAPRPRRRAVDRAEPSYPPDPQPQAEEKPLTEPPPKIEALPDPAPAIEAPPPLPAPIPAAPEAPAEIPSPKIRAEPIAPIAPAEPISQ